MIPDQIAHFLHQIQLPEPHSHKGQNGKLLIIGGSELFHAASKWSLDVASQLVDMVFYSSIPSNNQLVLQAKENFWNGIVVERPDLESYLDEAHCVLIGPGMTREEETAELTNTLLAKYPDKKWVVDAGALQMVEPQLLNERCIITPHSQELQRLADKMTFLDEAKLAQVAKFSSPLTAVQKTLLWELQQQLHQPVIVFKGAVDYVLTADRIIEVEGGNAGMTKGGTGDVLAGLIAALYCTQSADTAAVVGSFINKKAGEELYHQVGPFFNASDLVRVVPGILWKYLRRSS